MSLGLMFLSAVVADQSVSKLLEYGQIDYLFKGHEQAPYEFVREFVKQHQAIPQPATIEAHTGVSLVAHKEPATYYLDLLQLRHTEHSVKGAMKVASDLLLPENKNPDKALEILTDMVMTLAGRRHSKQVVDFREAYDLIIADYKAKFNAPDDYGLQFGWPTFDEASGGLMKGDVVSMVGRPGIGKTLFMLYAALHGWKQSAQTNPDVSRMFVSMEMGVLPIEQRLAGLQLGISSGQIKNAGLITDNLKKLKKGLTEIKTYAAPFYIVDGNLTATVEDIWMLARQLKVGAIFIDGAYLLKHPTEHDRYKRVAENADLIKKELAPICPVTASWQFARTASKKNAKKGEKIGLDDIAYADAIGQMSSVVAGLFQEESVEVLKKRKIEILKGRSGETGSFEVNWNWKTMDFTEVVETDVSELQFL
jgi:replicative DNA helicase